LPVNEDNVESNGDGVVVKSVCDEDVAALCFVLSGDVIRSATVDAVLVTSTNTAYRKRSRKLGILITRNTASNLQACTFHFINMVDFTTTKKQNIYENVQKYGENDKGLEHTCNIAFCTYLNIFRFSQHANVRNNCLQMMMIAYSPTVTTILPFQL